MKAILISIKPKYVTDILNGKKTLEIRKSIPKCDLPIDVYIYCTKGKGIENFLCKVEHNFVDMTYKTISLNGKVVAKFTLNKIEQVWWIYENTFCWEEDKVCITKTLRHKDFIKQCCLSQEGLNDYIGDGESYAWHISNLEIFDKPKEISEFKAKGFERIKVMGSPYGDLDSVAYHYEKKPKLKSLTHAPQSWCYIEV